MSTERNRRATILGALVLLLAACSPGKDDVEKRAVERWNYLIARQADKAYDYLSPGAREMQTRENYAASMNNRPVKWTAAKFNRKECDADRCKVYIDVSYSVVMPGAGIGKPVEATSTQSEIWVRAGDGWYFLPK
ncbi:MAG TPA: hypothetical protein VHC92_10730 [Rhodanobacteraceae bacterium]|jgi:hypothetical protein|nr:hypothetical protein [Rhodanobacteraceae bacterium]